ncbi:MAG: hypothetical protein IJL66_07390 [Lachnospiraceae bacterium]|nr:hypothetical protein [Lachnospiraceae bacterium]
MELRELLEQDKERVLSRFSAAQDMTEAAGICEEEMGRLLLRYQEERRQEEAAPEAARALRVASAAAPMIAGVGQVRAYQQVDVAAPKKKGEPAVILMLIAALLSLGGAAAAVIGRADNFPDWVFWAGWAAVVAGIFVAFFAGRKSKHYPEEAGNAKRYEVHPDGQRLFRAMTAVAAVIDRSIAEAAEEKKLLTAQSLPEDGPLAEDELELFGRILENARTMGGDEGEQLESDVRFFLHQKGIEAVSYDPEKAHWFELLPGDEAETLRPALVCGGKLLKKGLAAGAGSI